MNKPDIFKQANISQGQFLQDYWHKAPLLIKNALAANSLNFQPDKAELIRLSGDEDIQSRLVIKHSEDDYTVECGPFVAEDFQQLQQDPWNLLVSDIDKWLPQSREILKYFTFVRNWVFDDIMLSCGSIGGTVGPHTDHYEVFLIQLRGQRKWSFGHDKIYNPALKADIDLKLMANFSADETTVCQAGDVLYLPAEVAHYGIVASDDCVTCSVGVRLPSHAELMTAFVDYVAQMTSDDCRFSEPQFQQQPAIGEITAADINAAKQILNQTLNPKNHNLSLWFGQFITEYRSLFFEFNQYQDFKNLDTQKMISLSPFSKASYIKQAKQADLFVNGQYFQASLALAENICDAKTLNPKYFTTLTDTDKKILKALFKNGSLRQED